MAQAVHTVSSKWLSSQRTCLYYILISIMFNMKHAWTQDSRTDVWTPSFPMMEELFGGNITEGCSHHYCPSKGFSNSHSVGCHCDSDCWKRRDCCLNAWSPSLEIDDFDVDVDSRPTSVDLLISNDRLTCQPVVIRHEFTSFKVTSLFAMVAQCFNGSVGNRGMSSKQCEDRTATIEQDPLMHVPVTSHVTNITYRNLFCAICNEDVINVSFWKVSLSCRNQITIRNVTDALQHFLNEERKSKCNLEMKPITGINRQNMLPVHRCMKPPATTPVDDCPMVTDCATQWQSESEAALDVTRRTKVSWLCRTIYAPIYLKKKSYKNIYCAICNNAIQSNSTEHKPKCYKPKHSFMSKCPPICPPLSSIRTKSFTLLMDVDLRGGGLMVGTVERCPAAHVYDVFHEDCRVIVCGKGYEYKDGICVRTFKEPLLAKRLVTTISNGSSGNAQSQNAACLRIRYQAEEVELDANWTLIIRGTGQKFLQGEYEWESDTQAAALVCTDLTNTYVTKFPEFAFEYVTIGGSILSVMALFLKMAIFACLPETRNFPDRIVFCLSLSLFVAQLLFATTVTNTDGRWKVMCLTTAVLMHYFFLSAFAWMNVLAFDVWRTFSTTEATMHITSKRRSFLRYSAYAWGAPLGLVLTSVILDYTEILDTDSPYRPYYGLVVCWISGRLALTYVFVIPIGLLIAANTALFSCTAWNIRSSSRQASMVQTAKHFVNQKVPNHSNKNQHLQFFLYVKLGMVMGLTWISGFVAIFARISFIWYVFTLLNTLQGIYVFMAFTPYRKMRRIWHRMRHSKYSYCQSSYTNSHMPLRKMSTNRSQLTKTSSLDNHRTSLRSS